MRRIYKISIAFAVAIGPFLFLMAICSESVKSTTTSNAIRNQHHESPSGDAETHRLYSIGGSFDEGFSSVFKSVFPIDSVISFNISNTSTHNIVARYATFSSILNYELKGHFATLPGTGCQKPSDDVVTDHHDKILIVKRGECPFVEKVENLLNSKLSPRAIIIANNVAQDELITMYHRFFNHDGKIKTPMLFISLEDYEILKSVESLNIMLSISTVTLDSIMGISLSMALSPPILFLLFYLTIRVIQHCRHRRMSVMNERYVAQLPVYMYMVNHLVPCSNYYEYLKATNQTEDVPFISSSSEDLAVEEIEATSNYDSLVVNGTDLYSLRNLELLFSKTDYYPTSKCSICLGRLVPLQSRVLLLRCKHIYHEKCLSNWLINFKKSCPLCNNMLRLTDESRNYGTFGRDLEAASDEFLQHDENFLQDDERGSLFHDNESLTGPQIIASTPHSGHSYVSMPILPTRVQDPGSPSISASSGLSYVTTRSESIEVSGTSVTSEYLTPAATIDTSADDNQTEAAQSMNSTLTCQSQ